MAREEFYPYLAYIDTEGRPSAPMFDGIIYDFSRGTECKLLAWEEIIDSLFAKEGNLRGLDSAVADVKLILGLPRDYKYKIYFSAPLPKVSREEFGDLNGDGIAEKLLDSEDCFNAYCRFTDMLIRRFNSEGFSNITVDGWLAADETSDFAENLRNRGYNVLSEAFGTEMSIPGDIPVFEPAGERESVRIFRETEPKSVLNWAVSQDESVRGIYDSLYGCINNRGSDEESDEFGEIAVPDISFDEPESDFSVPEITVSEILPEPELETPELEVELEIEDTADIVIEENFEDIEPEITEEPTESIEEPEKPAEKSKTAKPKKTSLAKDKKYALVGAGVIAAVLGLAYILKKSTED